MLVFIPLVSVLNAYLRSLVQRKLKYKNINVDDKLVPDDVVPLMESRRRVFAPKSKGASQDNENSKENQEDDK